MSILVDDTEIETRPPYSRFMIWMVNYDKLELLYDITAKDGLLWNRGEIVPLPLADEIANMAGFMCAERMVKAMDGAVRETREW